MSRLHLPFTLHLPAHAALVLLVRKLLFVLPGCISFPLRHACKVACLICVQPEFHIQTLTVKLKTSHSLPASKVNAPL